VLVNWNKRWKDFKEKDKINPAKILLRKCITILDIKERDRCWEKLKDLCRDNFPEGLHTRFLQYYHEALNFWSLGGIPRSVFVYSSFSNSIVESANGVVQDKDILDANSTLRVIFIASSSFDEDVKPTNILTCPPIVKAKEERQEKNQRKTLLEALHNCSSPIHWGRLPDNLTCKCLKTLISSFKASNLYYAFQDRLGTYRVEKGESGTAHPDTALVVENSDLLLVCTSCRWFNVHGSPCPHVLSACKKFRPAEKYLPFITRNLRVGEGVSIQQMFSKLHVESDDLGVWSKDDVLDIEEIAANLDEATKPNEEHAGVEEATEPNDGEFPDHFEQFGGTDQSPKSFSQEIHIVPKRIGTAEMKLDEAMGSGKKAESARRWLWDNIAYPTQKDSSYDKRSFCHFWTSFIKARDECQGQFQRLVSQPQKKKPSLLSRIGNSQNLKTTTASETSAVQRSSKKTHSVPQTNEKKGSKRTRSPADEKTSRVDKRGAKKTAGATTTGKKGHVPETQKCPTSTNKKTSAATTTAKRQVPVTQKLNSASTKKKSPATGVSATYEVEEFLAKSDEKILVAWRHHSDLTWEPIKTLKKDLGSNYVALCKRMEDRAKYDDGESITSSDDDDTPLSSLMGSRITRRK
jgi:hypothetical protein